MLLTENVDVLEIVIEDVVTDDIQLVCNKNYISYGRNMSDEG